MTTMKKYFLLSAVLLTAPLHGAVSSNIGKSLGTEGGRYVLGQISEFRRDQFMLDTKSGRVWTVVESNGSKILQPLVFFCGVDLGSLYPECAPSFPYSFREKQENINQETTNGGK